MATYDITSASFNINNVNEGDILNCPYTGSETSITLPAGTYKITAIGATGNMGHNGTAPTGTAAYVGGGGTSIGELTVDEDTTYYINVGGCGEIVTSTANATHEGGYNGGGSTKYYGGVGGGATHMATRSGLLSSLKNYKNTIIIVAGGGGGSNYYKGNSTYTGTGGSGGGTTGANGTSSGSANYAGKGGSQTAAGAAGTGSSRAGTAGSFGQGGSHTSGSTSYASSAGGGGYYGGGAGSYQEAGGGGGSGYISNILENASTTQGTQTATTSNGSFTIEVISFFSLVRYNIDLTLSGGNFTDGHINGTYSIREDGTDSFYFIPLSNEDPVSLFINGVDESNSLSRNPTLQSLSVTTTAPGASYGFSLNNNWYVSQNKGVAKSAAVARVEINAIEKSTVTFTVINYAEEGYDFGVLGLLDTPLQTVYNSDNSGYWSGFSSDRNKSTEQTITYNVPIGQHFIDVKYIKDDATNSNNDTLQFKVSINPAVGEQKYIYNFNTQPIVADTEIKIICGDVSSNFAITAAADHANVEPEFETLYKGSNYELHFIPIDTENYRYKAVYDNNNDVSAAVVAPHTLPDPTYSVQSVSGAEYGFALTGRYYQSQNTAANTAALCKVVFNTPVAALVTMTYQNTGYYTSSSSSQAQNFSMISELNTDLRTDSATDTSGIRMNGANNFHSTDTTLTYEIPAGESYITCKHKITSTRQTTGNLKFKIEITPLESLDINYYTYTISNVQEVHNILILSEKIPEYNINITYGPMGSVSPSGIISVKEGNSLTINCSADTNYSTDQIFLNSQPVSFSNDEYTLSNIQGDANIYVLFTSGDSGLFIKNPNWIRVVQAYKKINGRWEEQIFATVGDPNTKYVRKEV